MQLFLGRGHRAESCITSAVTYQRGKILYILAYLYVSRIFSILSIL